MNTFDARMNQFSDLRNYEKNEPRLASNRHKVVSVHQRRVANLKAMYGDLVGFFG
jgi:hypothetical protein